MLPRSMALLAERLPYVASVAVIAGALLTGCSSSDAPSGGLSVVDDTAVPTASTGETIGGSGSQIQLDELTESDLEGAALSGELACSFSKGNSPPILFATGIVASDEPAQGVIKVSGHVERIGAPGGFGGISNAPAFTAQGKTITITSIGPASAGGESPPRPATLTYRRADGASRAFAGRWQCGP